MSLKQDFDRDRASDELRGNTLRVYWYLSRSREKSVSAREVQRALSFSSPTLAVYHLEKLRDLGLVVKESGDYKLLRELKIDSLRQFTTIGAVHVPRFSIYAIITSTLFGLYLVGSGLSSLLAGTTGLFLGLFASAIFWLEAWKVWSQKPSGRSLLENTNRNRIRQKFRRLG